ncbi:GFA family protein [Piscinibacter sp. XHJ-5]|uniref:GFA family protein n=1 Tax=Piscinibacter sp. XHJ-5 TaxID=3037797 RepID=UPI002452DEFC|nr:GFA family protein [Piscinibacter sp. XHJ-5]
MARIEGGCLCGAIRYRSSAEPLLTVVCQCSHCQRTSGSAYSVMLAMPVGSIEFSGQPLASYDDMGTSGMLVHRRFCDRCGSPIVSDAEVAPTMHFLKTGSLDDASWVRPQAAIWCNSAQPWAPLPEGMQKVPQNPAFG